MIDTGKVKVNANVAEPGLITFRSCNPLSKSVSVRAGARKKEARVNFESDFPALALTLALFSVPGAGLEPAQP